MANTSTMFDLPLPAYIDRLAREDPDRVFAELLVPSSTGYGRETITMAGLVSAVDEAARWLDGLFGKDGQTRFLAFMAPAADIRYLIFMLAAVKSGRVAFWPSPRNDAEAQCSLFNEYKCDVLLLPKASRLLQQMSPVIDRLAIDVHELPDVHHLLATPPKTYNWTVRKDVDFRTEPLVGTHTSGTTGIPKAVIIRHGNATALEHWKSLPAKGYGQIIGTQWPGKTMLMGFPMFHTAAQNWLMIAIQNRIHLVFPPAIPGPLTAETVCNILQHINVDILSAGPSLLADIAGSQELVRTFSRLQAVTFGGGPLPKSAGNIIQQHCDLVNLIGWSEGGIVPCEILDPEDWQYVKFSPAYGCDMRPFEDLYELVIVRHKKWEDFQVIFFTFPELQEWSTKDLFSPHPTKPGLWLWQGRRDDIVVYSTGEKFNPTDMENAINGSPSVSAALVYGQERPLSALLTEPKDYSKATEVIDRVWPLVQKANGHSPSHARILKDMILVTTADKPLPRAGKGTVQRKAAFNLYADELDALYDKSDDTAQGQRNDSVVGTKEPDSQVLTKQILDIVCQTSGLDLEPGDDFFDGGLDSLGVIALLRSLKKTIAAHAGQQREILAKNIYEHPSATSLASHLCGTGKKHDPTQIMEELYSKYTLELPFTARRPQTADPNRKVVILTGSTGTLGTYLFYRLLKDESVERVFCLNRSEDAKERQAKSMEAKGLRTDSNRTPFKFITTDLSRPYFGLDTKEYRALLWNVTHVVHNAWHVNFNLPVGHFESPHISSVKQLVDFSAKSRHGAQIVFISSIGAVSAYDPGQGNDIPEMPIKDWTAAPADSGYGQSKLVSERILTTAAPEAQVPVAIIRVGQIAGPTDGKGVWPKQEWLPSLVMSSRYLGCLPETLGSYDTVDWIPIDTAAQVVVDFVNHASRKLNERFRGALVYHVVNPNKTSWATLLPTAQQYLGIDRVVSYDQWVEALAEFEDTASDENPATRLLAFYRSIAKLEAQAGLDTTTSMEASETLANMPAIIGEMFATWLRGWLHTASEEGNAGAKDEDPMDVS